MRHLVRHRVDPLLERLVDGLPPAHGHDRQSTLPGLRIPSGGEPAISQSHHAGTHPRTFLRERGQGEGLDDVAAETFGKNRTPWNRSSRRAGRSVTLAASGSCPESLRRTTRLRTPWICSHLSASETSSSPTASSWRL